MLNNILYLFMAVLGFIVAHGLFVVYGLSSYSTQALLPSTMCDLSSPTKDRTLIPCIRKQFFTTGPPKKSLNSTWKSSNYSPFQSLSWSHSLIHWTHFSRGHTYILGFPSGSADKESACNLGDLGWIPGLGRSPGEGKGYPLQYSDLENSMEYIVHGVAKSWTQLSNFHFFTFILLQNIFYSKTKLV